MSLFTRPVILVPGSDQWDANRRHRSSERAPRRDVRRTVRSAPMRRPSLDYVWATDPYEYLFTDDYPESGFYDVPARYVDNGPGRFYGNQTVPRPDLWNPEGHLFGSGQTSCHDSVHETERSDESEEEMAEKNVNPVVMDMEQILGQVLNQLYGKKTKPRHGNVSGKVKEPKRRAEGNETKKNRTTPKQKTVCDQKRKYNAETKPDKNQKVVDLEVVRAPAKAKEDKMVAPQRDTDTIQERDAREGKESSHPEVGHREVISVPEYSSRKDDLGKDHPKDNLLDTSEIEVKSSCEDGVRNKCEDEVPASCEDDAPASCEDEGRASCEDDVPASWEDDVPGSCEDEARSSCEDGAHICCEDVITDNFEGSTPTPDKRSNEEKQEVKGSDELIAPAYTHLTDHTPETNNGHGPEDTLIDDVKDSPSKFKMTFDFSSFLPDEVQARMADDKLIMDAVHEVVEEGLSEKLTMHKELVLPPSVDVDSLRCLLAADGHMMISANYKDNWKHSKILTIETNGH